MKAAIEATMVKVNSACPPQSRATGDQELNTQLESYAYLYNMLWSGLQLAGFIVILFVFLVSHDNEYNVTKKCCQATTVLRDDLNIPERVCSQPSCLLHDYLYDDERDFIQQRPRRPQDGDHSRIFEWDGARYCCHLDKEGTKCCDRQPWDIWCTASMWVAAFSSICAMVMTQTVIQGIYSFSARLRSWHPIVVAFPITVLRTLMFFMIFYIFWGFMFCFIFFWVPLFYCDNPHAFGYWHLGYDYIRFWFAHFGEVFFEGAREPWDGKMDTDAFVGSHSIYSLCCDLVFTTAYYFLNQTKDKKGHSYLNLGYFDL